ncbi:uncharacterized protein METZ01_LOCUS472151 [marine metagenome]|uniref:Uncharacterized protein n=1 Tax=marine metagenome TaxID=408172 RepID=A0A383BGQ5_9ZZZZ
MQQNGAIIIAFYERSPLCSAYVPNQQLDVSISRYKAH